MKIRGMSYVLGSIILTCALALPSVALAQNSQSTLQKRTVIVQPKGVEGGPPPAGITPVSPKGVEGGPPIMDVKINKEGLTKIHMRSCVDGFKFTTDVSICPDQSYEWACIDERPLLSMQCPYGEEREAFVSDPEGPYWDYSPGIFICAYPTEMAENADFRYATNIASCGQNAKRFLVGQPIQACSASYPDYPGYIPDAMIDNALSTLCRMNVGFTCGWHSREVKACKGTVTSEMPRKTDLPGSPGHYIHCCK